MSDTGWSLAASQEHLPPRGSAASAPGPPMSTGRHPRGNRPRVHRLVPAPAGVDSAGRRQPVRRAAARRTGSRAPKHPDTLRTRDQLSRLTGTKDDGPTPRERRPSRRVTGGQEGQRRSVAHSVTDRAVGQDCYRAERRLGARCRPRTEREPVDRICQLCCGSSLVTGWRAGRTRRTLMDARRRRCRSGGRLRGAGR
jgi:hypothetical protein